MDSAQSQLGQVLKQPRNSEDQLTEIVALVLGSDDGLTRDAVHHLTGNNLKPSSRTTISTRPLEKLEGGLGRPDLEIRWTEGLVWIEVKRDMRRESRPHQLRDYKSAMQRK